MSEKYKIYDSKLPYFISFATVNWVDVFIRNEYQQIIVDSLNYCVKHKSLNIYAWVLMPNHIHLIANSDDEDLSSILRDFKRHTSSQLKSAIQSNISESRRNWLVENFTRNSSQVNHKQDWIFWQSSNHPIELNTNEMIEQRLTYLHENPVKAGFVELPEHWFLSSARDYCGLKGLVECIIAT
jgi:REP element-mobilizing transposase RayT